MLRKLNILLVNIMVFVSLYLPIDLMLGVLVNDPVKFMCKDKRLHHKYCPKSKRVYRMVPEDGGGVFISYWNAQGLRVKESSDRSKYLDTRAYDIINIGDSFMAQRQVEFDERVSSFLELETGLSVLQAGVGSWSVVNYRNWIEDNQFKLGVTVNVFLMANDLYPFKYGMSNENYHKQTTMKDGRLYWLGEEEETNSLQRFMINYSFTYQKLKNNKRSTDYASYLKNYRPFVDSITIVRSDCSELNSLIDEGLFTPYALSNIVFAFEETCWPDAMRTNVDLAVNDIKAIEGYLRAFQARLFLYVIPNGWALEGESLAAKNHPLYQIDRDAVITMQGVVSSLREKLDIPVISIEEELSRLKHLHSDDVNYYYSYDGHWNVMGSKAVAQMVANKIGGGLPSY